MLKSSQLVKWFVTDSNPQTFRTWVLVTLFMVASKAFWTLNDSLLKGEYQISASASFAMKCLCIAQFARQNVLDSNIKLNFESVIVDSQPDGAQFIEGENQSICNVGQHWQGFFSTLEHSTGFQVGRCFSGSFSELNSLLQSGDFVDQYFVQLLYWYHRFVWHFG